MIVANLNQPLPSKFGPKINKETADKYIKDFLKDHLPDSDKHQVDTEENWRFPLEKIGEDRKKRKVKSQKKKLLSRNEKQKLGLSKLTKTGWDYSKILPMNKIWIGYMDENLEFAKRAPTWTEADYTSFCAVLNKSELIGAEISIIRSSTPSYIGIKGIIVYETKFTFQIVSSDSKFKGKRTIIS